MRVQITRSHSLGGGVDVYQGEEVELDDKSALLKIQQGWAVPVTAKPVPEPVATATADSSQPAGESESSADESAATTSGRRKRS